MAEEVSPVKAPVVTPVAAPMDDGNREFPMPFGAFADVIKGTPDEVWTAWLRKNHAWEAHTLGEWRAVLNSHRNKPAHPSVLGK